MRIRPSPLRGAIAHKVILPRNFQIQIQNPIRLFLSFNQLRYPRTMIYLIERFSLDIYNTIYIISSSLNWFRKSTNNAHYTFLLVRLSFGHINLMVQAGVCVDVFPVNAKTVRVATVL